MKDSLFAMHFLEMLILLPSSFYALFPAREYFRFPSAAVWGAAGAAVLAVSTGGACLCSRFGWSTNTVLLPSLLIFLLLYVLSNSLSLSKKLFLFANAAALGAFCTCYMRFITAPQELGRDAEPFLVSSSLICLGIGALVAALFFRSFYVKLPWLLAQEHLDHIWWMLAAAACGFTLILFYMNPRSADVIMTGRVRGISMLLFLLFPGLLLFFYHNLWSTNVKLADRARLEQQNTILMAERKRYEDLSNYIDETRILRHDFRHHLVVIEKYATEGERDLLLKYLHDLDDVSAPSLRSYCANRVIDAVASYYDAIAAEKQVQILWALDLPGQLKVEETDLCAIFGNLVENAIHATSSLPPDSRRISVTSQMLSPSMLGICVENPCEGDIRLDRNGLPVSRRGRSGTGLKSVASITAKYHGTMEVTTESGVFGVNILLML